jgi:hypothetical protein
MNASKAHHGGTATPDDHHADQPDHRGQHNARASERVQRSGVGLIATVFMGIALEFARDDGGPTPENTDPADRVDTHH